MRHEDNLLQAGQGILVVDTCSFRRLAICHCLSAWSGGVTGVSRLEDIPAVRTRCVGGVVLGLGGTLSDLMRQLRSLAALLSVMPVPVALVTDMSPCCALALLTLAGIPSGMSGDIRIIPSGLSAARVRDLLLTALRWKSPLPGVGRYRLPLSPQHLDVLGGMIAGLDEVTGKPVRGADMKTLYSQRYATLRRLRVAGRHALLCGRFALPVSRGRVASGGGAMS